jgi:hypothetical protein
MTMGFPVHPIDDRVMQPEDRRRHCDACGVDGRLTRVSIDGGGPSLQALLCTEHAGQLVRALSDCLKQMQAEHAAPAMLNGRRLRDGEALDVIREWARAGGYPVSKQGSVSQGILDAYRDVGGDRRLRPVRT